VLDAGCGDGRNLRYLLARGFDCHGLDRDVRAVDHVRHLAAAAGLDQVDSRFVVGDVDQLPWADGGMGKQLQRALTKQGMTFRLETSATGIEKTADGVRVTVAGKTETSQIDADVVLVAIGRRPYADGLGAREIGVAFDDRGRITVNGRGSSSRSAQGSSAT